MKDHNLEDIGRRLYDLEADPPKDGWDKLGAAIRAGQPSPKIMWLQRNWWKPLVIIVPFLFYFLTGETSIDPSHTSASLEKIANAKTEANPPDTKSAPKTSVDVKPNLKVSEVASNSAMVQGKNNVGTHLSKIESSSLNQVVRDRGVNSVRPNQPADLNDTSSEADAAPAFNNDVQEVGSNVDPLVKPSSISSIIVSQEVSANKLTSATEVALDSLADEEKEKDKELIVSQSYEESKEEESSNINPWRITIAAMPQFIWRSVSPNQNDEVFVTDVNDANKGFANLSGYNFSVGVNRAISPQWQLDGQLSFSRTKQEVQLSYTNGNVDTLLAVVQADQSVRLVPVYEQSQQHIMNKYSFVGLRLGATHYFWARNKRRFNFSAAFGANYMVSASVTSLAESGWQNLPTDGLQKVHYNLSVGAGYNYNFAHGWELMVSPTLLYNLRPLKSDQLPYQMTQRAFGLNVMVSKSLGK